MASTRIKAWVQSAPIRIILPVVLTVALGIVGVAIAQGVTGLVRNFTVEFLAQRIEGWNCSF